MQFVFIDESNPEPTPAGAIGCFLVYGAVLIDAESVSKLNDDIEEIRNDLGFLPDDKLKFSPNDRPNQISRDDHIISKERVLKAAAKRKVRTILYCAHHDIIDSRGQEVYLNWGLDALFTKVQQYVNEEKEASPFSVFVDRHSRNTYAKHLREKFVKRNIQPKAGFNTPGLVCVSSVWDGTSHLASLADIIVGSYNYIVNKPERDVAGRQMILALRPLIWGHRDTKKRIRYPLGRGLLFRPEIDEIRKKETKALYEETKDRIFTWANEKNDME